MAMPKSVAGKKVAFLVTDGFEQVELTRPWAELSEEGAEVRLVSPKDDEVQGMHHAEKGDTFPVDVKISDARPEDFDALVLPGGVANPDSLRVDGRVLEFVRAFHEQRKPIAAICHGPWTLIDAEIVKGVTLTSWPSLRKDLENAGAHWVDEEVHVDQGLVTSRNPDDLDAFCAKAKEEIAAGPRTA